MENIRFDEISIGDTVYRYCTVNEEDIMTFELPSLKELGKEGNPDITGWVQRSDTTVNNPAYRIRNYYKLYTAIINEAPDWGAYFIVLHNRVDLSDHNSIYEDTYIGGYTLEEIEKMDPKLDIYWDLEGNPFVRDYSKLRDLINKIRPPVQKIIDKKTITNYQGISGMNETLKAKIEKLEKANEELTADLITHKEIINELQEQIRVNTVIMNDYDPFKKFQQVKLTEITDQLKSIQATLDKNSKFTVTLTNCE